MQVFPGMKQMCPGCRVTMFQGYNVSGLHGYNVSELQICKVWKFWNVSGLKSFWFLVSGFRVSGFRSPCHPSPGLPSFHFRVTGLQSFMVTGFQGLIRLVTLHFISGFRGLGHLVSPRLVSPHLISELQGYRVSGLQGFRVWFALSPFISFQGFGV